MCQKSSNSAFSFPRETEFIEDMISKLRIKNLDSSLKLLPAKKILKSKIKIWEERTLVLRGNYAVKVIQRTETKRFSEFWLNGGRCRPWQKVGQFSASFRPFDRDETASVVSDPLFARVNAAALIRVHLPADISFPSFRPPTPLIFPRRCSAVVSSLRINEG